MKANEAKELSQKYNQLIEVVKTQLQSIYQEIRISALNGMVAYHYHSNWLGQKGVESEYLTNTIVDTLREDGYDVSLKDSNPNDCWLLISWM